MSKLRIDVWSDIACPWCYVGKRRLEAALARFPQSDQVEVVWRAFELDPSAPKERDGTVSYAERLSKKYGSPVAEAEAQIARMVAVARADGLVFDFQRIRPGNTFDAHRLVHLGEQVGLQDAVKERFLRAYMTEGEGLGDAETLLRLAVEAGLPADSVKAVLGSDALATDVRADEQEAQELGIRGVPFFVFDGKLAVSGAQPADLLLGALTQAFRDRAAQPVTFEEGAACGPEGCA